MGEERAASIGGAVTPDDYTRGAERLERMVCRGIIAVSCAVVIVLALIVLDILR